MEQNYDLKQPQGCIDYLNDLLAELELNDFEYVIRDNFPKAEADKLIEKYTDEVIIPLGKMLEVIERAHQLTSTPMSTAQKIEYARAQQGQKLLSVTMYQTLHSTTIGHIERAANAIKAALITRINQIPSGTSTSDDGIDREDAEFYEREKALSAEAAERASQEKLDALTRHHQSLQLIAEQLNARSSQLNVHAPLATRQLYKAVQALEKVEERTGGIV